MKTALIEAFAKHFHKFGLNITCIGSERNPFNFLDRNLLKAPNHSWTHLIDNKQSEDELSSYAWEKSTGLGLVLGYDGLMALDIDGCVEYDLIKAICNLLLLPDNYEWIIKSGSGAGYHILFFCENIEIDRKQIEEDLKKLDLFTWMTLDFQKSTHIIRRRNMFWTILKLKSNSN
jgi:hypothetical protein